MRFLPKSIRIYDYQKIVAAITHCIFTLILFQVALLIYMYEFDKNTKYFHTNYVSQRNFDIIH